MSEHSHLLALVTDMPEWKPLFVAAEAAGIPADAITIRQERVWNREARRGWPGAEVEVEIRNDRTWSMDEAQRAGMERKLREAVPVQWNTPSLRFLWRKPIPAGWGPAWLDAVDKLSRDLHRRRIDDESFRTAHDRLYALHRRVSDQAEDHRPLMPLLAEMLAEARQHPPPPKDLAPLQPDEVGVHEVMAVLRRVATGAARPRIIETSGDWRLVWHSIGEFEVDGWTIQAFKRTSGMQYINSVRAPDGRIGDHQYSEEREGNPFSLLEDDEQDAIFDVLDSL